jgi:peptide-O-fucosyltransferase
MNDFMEYIAPKVWPEGNRSIFCYGSRSNTKRSCEAKEGNPFGPYWDKFDVNFDNDVFYGPLSYDTNFVENQNSWMVKYSGKNYPVLAFTGPPGSFPVDETNVYLHKYLKWSDDIDAKATQFLKRMNKKNEKSIGLHLRNGVDFVSY